MRYSFLIVVFSIGIFSRIAAQANWAAIPCFKMKEMVAVNSMFVDSLHNELIINSADGSEICNTTYKGLFAYNGTGFHDLSLGVETHDPSPTHGGTAIWDCITYGNKTLYGGYFNSVGTNSLITKSLALWNGAVWDTFPTHVFSNRINSTHGGFYGFLKHQGKLWMYGNFDTIGTTVSKNIVTFDGKTFTPVPPLPINYPGMIYQLVPYRNKLIATGIFYNHPPFTFLRLAQFDGTSWSEVGNGIQGGLASVFDMMEYKDTLYIAGAFSKSDGNFGNYVMKWDGNKLLDAGFGDFCGWGSVRRLLTFNNRLYAFGSFACVAQQKAFGMAYYENGKWIASPDSINAMITGAEVYNGTIYIGGGFNSINEDTTIQKLARLLCPDFDAKSGCLSGLKVQIKGINGKIFPNPSTGIFKIEKSGNYNITIYDAIGRLIDQQKAIGNTQVELLRKGIYIVMLETGTERTATKVVVY